MTYEVKAEGIVLIEVLDATTLEVKRTYEEKNDITKTGAFYLSAGSFYKPANVSTAWPYYANVNYGANYSNPSPYGLHTQLNSSINPIMYISEKKYIKPVFLERYMDSVVAQSSSVIAGDFTSNNGNPDTLTFKRRFNAPATNRSIWCIGLGSGQVAAGTDMMTFCALTAPCSQLTTEILDITYKIQFYWSLNSNSTTPGVAPTSDMYSIGMVYANCGKDYGKFSTKAQFMPNKLHKSKYQYRSWGVPMYEGSGIASSYPDTGDSILATNWNVKGTTQTKWDISIGIGRIIQSVYHRAYDQVPHGTFAPFGGPAFLNKPIQPVHSHNSASNVPFMDTTNPGSSLGTLSLSGASWTNSEKFPEYYKIMYAQTGGNGIAKYNFSYAPTTGFVGNTFASTHYDLAYTERRTTKWQGYENTTLVGMHGSSRELPCNWEEYSDTKFVLFDDTGITITDIANGDAVTFDATTNPALPVTKIAQIAVNFSNKDVWVACSNTGLYKIQDAFGTPVISKITTINGTNINAAYAVSLGYNNSIVCAYNGGLAITNNHGVSWTTYNPSTTPAFSFAGVSDNWAKIRTIRTDIQSPTNEMLIVYEPATGTTYSSCWWSTATAATAGPSSLGSAVALSNGVQPIPKYWVARCSHYGSMWVVGVNNQSVNDAVYLHIAKFGAASTVLNLNSENASNLSYTNIATPQNVNISFYYDYYKNPHVAVFRRIQQSNGNYVIHAISIINSRGNVVGTVRPHQMFSWTGWYGYTTPTRMYFLGSLGFNASYHMQPLMHIATQINTGAWPYEMNSFVRVITPQDAFDTCPGFPADSFNGRYTPFEEFVWKKFHWNSSEWVQNYYVPATDSSQYLKHAARHNFDTESHTFTGRSLIDISDTFKLSQSTGSTATFAFTVNSKAKLTAKMQELSSTLISLESATQAFRIVWTGGSNFEIHTGTTPTVTNISTALSNDTLYRIVVVVSGTNCSVYVNGAIAATLTLPNTLSLSDVTTAYLGAQVYNRSMNTRTPAPYGFFKGELTNIQIWNAAWTSTDVTSDYNNQASVISSQPAASLLGHFKLTEQLSETKATHSAMQSLTNGITIGFNEVSSQPSASFIKGDTSTFGVVDGILKDNAMSFTYDYYTYGYVNVDPNITEFTNASGANIVQAPTVITTPMNWIGNYTESAPGYMMITSTGYASKSIQTIAAATDFNFTFKASHSYTSTISIGATDSITYDYYSSYWNNNIKGFMIYFNNNGTFTIAEWANNTIYNTLIPNRSYVPGDSFSVARESGVIKYYHNGSLVYTSTRSVSNAFTFEYQAGSPFRSLIDCTLTYTEPKVLMYAGNLANKTGCFDAKFAGIEHVPATAISIKLDGVPANVTLYYDYLVNVPVPAPGSVGLIWKSGIIVLNPADIGKAVTGNVVGIFYRV